MARVKCIWKNVNTNAALYVWYIIYTIYHNVRLLSLFVQFVRLHRYADWPVSLLGLCLKAHFLMLQHLHPHLEKGLCTDLLCSSISVLQFFHCSFLDCGTFLCYYLWKAVIHKLIFGIIAPDNAFFPTKMYRYFSFLHKNICWGYSLEVPHQDTSNEYPQHYVFMEKQEKYLSGTLPYLELCWYRSLAWQE